MFVPSHDLSCICDSTVSFMRRRGTLVPYTTKIKRTYRGRKLCQTLLNNHNLLCRWRLQLSLNSTFNASSGSTPPSDLLHIALIHKTDRCLWGVVIRRLPGFSSTFIHAQSSRNCVQLLPIWLIAPIRRECVNILETWPGHDPRSRNLTRAKHKIIFTSVNFDSSAHSSSQVPNPFLILKISSQLALYAIETI